MLRIERLTKRYPAVVALDGLSVTLSPGRIGLVGANGAGKTTLFRLLLGLAHPTEGRIEVCGIDVATDPIAVRSRLGYMPEHDCLPLDQSAADFVATFGELSGLPPAPPASGPRTSSTSSASTRRASGTIGGFSTGMRQRTKLAQALVGDPELVLLDEPTAGLDPLGREEMLHLIARLGSFGISVLLATHLLDDVQQVCDHVVMIDAGRMVVSGQTDALLERTGLVSVDVGHRGHELVAGLARRRCPLRARRGRHPRRGDGGRRPPARRVRDTVVALELPLYRLSTRLTSLDEVFLRHAGTNAA